MSKSDDKTKSVIRRYISKMLILVIPIVVLTITYICMDPFLVLRDYDKYDKSDVFINESMLGWKMYMKNRDSILFNSFILGNSNTMAFSCKSWEQYLDGGKAFRLFGPAEGLHSVRKKLEALERVGAPLDNVLIIANSNLLVQYIPSSSQSTIQPPEIDSDNTIKFQETYFQAFLSPKFFIPYLDYKINGKYKPYMNGTINCYGEVRDSINNSAFNPREKDIENEGLQYWETREREFTNRKDPKYRNGEYKEKAPVLFDNQIEELNQIVQILKRCNTKLKFVITPDFDQVSFNKNDLLILNSIFGQENVYDFSGINKYTSNKYNYYEKTHFRPILGDTLLKKMYESDSLE